MSIRAAVISQIQKIAEGMGNTRELPPLTDDLALTQSGLDSLAIAILVTRLEDTLGFDPFAESDEVSYPVNLGDFIRFYENAAGTSNVNSAQDRQRI
ncbi:MAG TPA: hypothetical protein VGR73_19535 [Bryobacteraceae bacterium]|nr:hypothetical protein [Bryobacteraceae bacterium]